MKKVIPVLLLLSVSFKIFGQEDITTRYRAAENALQANNISEAYKLFKELEVKCDKKDTLYNYILWYCVSTTSELEKQHRTNEKFDSSLSYGLAALEFIKRGKPIFDENFSAREHWMHKNIIVSYFGLGQLENAKKYQDVLYKAYKEKSLPQGLDQYYNFHFFKWDNKNIWGYEWFEDLPEDRMSKSFSKIVYYVYSTKADGSDKDQLYRLHVLMFHKLDASVKFDYVLTKRLETAKNEASGTLYAYTYEKAIDYKKLQHDIREVLKGNYQPDAKSTIKQ